MKTRHKSTESVYPLRLRDIDGDDDSYSSRCPRIVEQSILRIDVDTLRLVPPPPKSETETRKQTQDRPFTWLFERTCNTEAKGTWHVTIGTRDVKNLIRTDRNGRKIK